MSRGRKVDHLGLQHCDFYWAAEAVEWVYHSLKGGFAAVSRVVLTNVNPQRTLRERDRGIQKILKKTRRITAIFP